MINLHVSVPWEGMIKRKESPARKRVATLTDGAHKG